MKDRKSFNGEGSSLEVKHNSSTAAFPRDGRNCCGGSTAPASPSPCPRSESRFLQGLHVQTVSSTLACACSGDAGLPGRRNALWRPTLLVLEPCVAVSRVLSRGRRPASAVTAPDRWQRAP